MDLQGITDNLADLGRLPGPETAERDQLEHNGIRVWEYNKGGR